MKSISAAALVLALVSLLAAAQAPAQPAASDGYSVANGKTTLRVTTWQETDNGVAELCLPLAQKELADAGAVRAIDQSGKELPMQVRALNSWPQDNSLRVLWLTVLADKKPFSIEYGRGVKRTDVPAKVTVKQDDAGTTIENGTVKITIPAREFKLFKQVWLDRNKDGRFDASEELLEPRGAITTLTTLEDKRYVPTGKPPEISVETAGGLYATLCVKGLIAPADKKDPAPEECFQVTYRIKVWAGSPAVQVQHVLCRLGQPFTLGVPTSAMVKKEWGLLVPVKSDGVELNLAGNALDYAAGGDGKVLDKGALSKDARKLIIASGDFEKNSPNVRFAEDGAPQAGALRWLDVSGGNTGVSVAVRNAAETFPKAYEINGQGTVNVDLWHDSLPYAVLEIGSGFHRTHDMVFNFHPGKADVANGEKACRATLPSYAAVPAIQFRKSRVFNLMPDSMQAFPEFKKLYGLLDRPGRPKYGDSAYGMAFRASPIAKMFGRMGNFGGDISNPMSVQSELFALTGDRKVLESVDENGRWTRDWNMKWRTLEEKATPIVQFPECSNTLVFYPAMLDVRGDPEMKALCETYKAQVARNERRMGMNALASMAVCRSAPCFRSNKSAQFEGVLYHYFLTGDTESLEGAKRYANFYHEILTNPKWYGNPSHNFFTKGGDLNKHRFHIFGPWMEYMAYFYEGTGDGRYLDAMKLCMSNIMKGANFDKFPDDDYIFWRGWIANVQFVCRNTARFCRSMYEYHRLTGDADVKKFAARIADAYINNYWDDKRNEFFWRPPLKSAAVDQTNMDDAKRNYWGMDNMYIATSLSYCYLVTGDPKYLDYIRKTYARCLEIAEGKTDGPGAQPATRKFDWAIGVDMNFENFWATYYVLEQAQKGR
ncbi:MAG: hypothetical protein ACE15C_07210 [Phycisphaerae bacterium]